MPAKNLADAIRLVPTAAHVSKAAADGLTYRGGPHIKNVAIHAIYWGSYWSTASSPSTANDQFGEIGDFCNAEPKTVGAYTVQKIWSASANRCV